ncbi:cache domain-containing sensor histidine kinase [Paenibacillus puerhi]|uniref:cache domain-containing sensor histidine kinase n=1 Tax=Paenibacillus puerhi TaxID=2692622 RepID=UPI001356B3F8|nr:sensor histidine kinase [Paenibacillus puerhi]
MPRITFIRLPASLKNRLFLAFISLILVPFLILSVFYFRSMERVLREQVSVQNLDQMTGMTRSLEELLSVARKTFTLLEQDSMVTEILKRPVGGENYDMYSQWAQLDGKLHAINNSLFISNSYVFYTLLDMKGRAYSSYMPAEPLHYDKLIRSEWAASALSGEAKDQWQLESDYTQAGIASPNRKLLSVTKVFRDHQNDPYAVVKISVDFQSWFRNVNSSSAHEETYTLISKPHAVAAQAGVSRTMEEVLPQLAQAQTTSGTLAEKAFIHSYTTIAGLDWILVKSMPTNILFARTDSLQRTFVISLFSIAVLFVFMTFGIASTVTRPLEQLRGKMADIVRSNLKVRLPENRYRGEIQTIVQAFNAMVGDMDKLIDRLKMEERQKETMRFQMLLSQMNPHFLLNTLNTVKWLAVQAGNPTIPHVCESLGRLVASGIRLDIDLIHWEQELELVESYVYIQQLRYDRQFEIRYVYEEALKYALVPKFCLQPLVENSIYHGFAGLVRDGVITIRATRIGTDWLELEVEDNGIGMKAAAAQNERNGSKGNGIALKNLEERLSLLFKRDAPLELPAVDKGTLVRFRVPLLISTPYQKEGSFDVDRTAR